LKIAKILQKNYRLNPLISIHEKSDNKKVYPVGEEIGNDATAGFPEAIG
jgi:hypothetical protein